jgi:hippurate hydrolase
MYRAENVIEKQPIMGSEDFGAAKTSASSAWITRFLRIFWLGAYDPAKVAKSERTGVALPSPHSPFFAPLPEPTLRTGVTAMTDAALAFLQ